VLRGIRFDDSRGAFKRNDCHQPIRRRVQHQPHLVSQGRPPTGRVGESGSGKSTLGKIVVRLIPPSEGAVLYRGVDVSMQEGRALLPYRHRVQVIFQDTHSTLNPRKRVGRLLAEALAANGTPRNGRRAEAARLLRLVGLDQVIEARYPHELSGGQRQRVGIERSLCMQPELMLSAGHEAFTE
jgi:ABC-type microcin C transport system duplicated ATPase subunit YejF